MAEMWMADVWRPSGWNDPSTALFPYSSFQPLAPGTLMRSRYRVVSQLGKGGMGYVYLVQDENFDARPLRSMKEMIPRLDDRQQHLHMVNFKREADVLETLRHPNIPRVYDSFTEFRRAYLVLEYVEGEDLEQVLDRTKTFLSPQQVGSWMIQLCTIVEYLHFHKPPIIFRDLKPSNVILTPDQRIILIDFGIAKVFTADEKQTNVGTQGYAAREQYKGEAEIRSDVYALGGMMHHLLTKSDPRFQPPFSFHERPPSRLNPAVTPELERVIMRCLEDDRDKRYQSVTELREALEDALHLSDSETASREGAVRNQEEAAVQDEAHATRGSTSASAYMLSVSAASADGADDLSPMWPGDAVVVVGATHVDGAGDVEGLASINCAEGTGAADTKSGNAQASVLPVQVPHWPRPVPKLGAWTDADNPERLLRTRRVHVRRVPAVWAVALLSVVVLLLTGTALYALAQQHGAVSITFTPFTSSNAFASSHASSSSVAGSASGGTSAGSSTSAGAAGPTAPQISTGTPGPGGSAVPTTSPAPGSSPPAGPTATPLPAPSATSTSTPSPPILTVSPTSITLPTCLAVTQTQFTVINAGGMSLSWTASATGSAYQISPATGTLAAGGRETVTVSNILLSGSVTVSAPDAQHSPQRVSIACTV